MTASGRPAKEAWIHVEGAEPIRVDLTTINSQFNYILILEQSQTERILEEEIGRHSIRVERRTELMNVEDRGSQVVSKIRLPNGDTQDIASDFVIGCDGAHSTVRHLLGVGFEG